MKLLALDVDGVLNSHRKLPGSVYCGIEPDCMSRLNHVIEETVCKLLITSAWRYQVLLGDMTLRGFENMLCTHGLVCPIGTVIGCTREDASPENCDRGEQIIEWLTAQKVDLKRGAWAVVDDMPEIVQIGHHQWRLVETFPRVGMQAADSDRLIEILGKKE